MNAKLILILAIATGPVLSTRAQTQPDDPVSTARKIYTERLEAIGKEQAGRVAGWPAQYSKSLDMLRARMQQAGEFEWWEACDRECKRFEQSGEIGEEDLVTEPTELRALQDQYREMAPTLTLDMNRLVVELTGRYIEHLDKQKAGYTKQGRMEQAAAFHAHQANMSDQALRDAYHAARDAYYAVLNAR